MSNSCLFCKIIKGEIPAKKAFENENVLGFVDIYPQAKNHLLFIHKNHSANILEMSNNASDISDTFLAISTFLKDNTDFKNGFRIVTNTGPDAGQTVFHTHFHVLGGEKLSTFGS
jgi:histidine triad (HIT) family protein